MRSSAAFLHNAASTGEAAVLAASGYKSRDGVAGSCCSKRLALVSTRCFYTMKLYPAKVYLVTSWALEILHLNIHE